MTTTAKDYFLSLRPKQWIKNTFIFAALFFSKNFFQLDLIILYILGFIYFSMLTSSIYLINDILDKDADKLHPKKKLRPIASGRIKVKNAFSLSILLTILALTGSFFLSYKFLSICFLYYFMNILYSLKLKKIVIVDIFCIAIGFVLRVLSSAVIGNIFISNWIIICTFMLSLFLGFTKRRHELLLLEENASSHRSILMEYSTYFLDQMISVVTTSTVVFYILYTVSQETIQKFNTKNLIYTSIFVIYGIFRYLYIAYKKESAGNPTNTLLTDIPLLITVFLWIITAGIIIYF